MRRWGFRLIAAVGLPLLLLIAVELSLRLSGFGHPTSFFLNKEIQGKRVLVENDQFGLSFFPPEMARSPSPLVMSAEKPPGTCRIFLLGESAALGDPEPAFGFGRYLQVLLGERFPQMHFEVICTAMTAINSHAILPIARECARHQGDIWVVYMGNNEFVGPFGPSTVFGPQAPPLRMIRAALWLKSTRLGQLVYHLASRRKDQETWGGMKMFLDHQVAPTDDRKTRVYDYFRSNLEELLAAAKRRGVKPVISTVAANLKDCAPFASMHPQKLTDLQKEHWEALYQAAVRAQAANDFGQARSNYQAAAQIDASFADLQFQWGQCELALSNHEEARRHFELARDCDSLPFRVDHELNSIIRETCRKHTQDGVRLVDSAAVLAKESTDGITGKEFLYEHVHLNQEGNYQIARAFAEAIAPLLPQRANLGNQDHWATFDDCARRLAVTDWDRRRIDEALLRRFAEPPFVNQIGHQSRIESLRQSIASARSRQTPEAATQARNIYERALEAAPEDLYLRGDYAKFLEDTGNFPEAIKQWRVLKDQIPFSPGPHFYLGKDLSRQGLFGDALAEFNTALEIRSDLPEALQEKGRLLTKTKRFEEALALLDRAAKLEPSNARICLDRAEALAASGRRSEALAQLQRAVNLQPNSWEAHYLLGVELAFAGSIQPATQQFLETVRLNPQYALGHLNLGIALAKSDRIDEAILQFEETLRLDPGNEKASQYSRALQMSHAKRKQP